MCDFVSLALHTKSKVTNSGAVLALIKKKYWLNKTLLVISRSTQAESPRHVLSGAWPFNNHMDVWMNDCLLIFHSAGESEWHQPSVTNYRHLCRSQLSDDQTSIGLHHMPSTVSVHPVMSFKMLFPRSAAASWSKGPTAEKHLWRTWHF